MSLAAAVDEIAAAIQHGLNHARPYRAIVTGVSGGLVTIRLPDATTGGTEGYARVLGFAVAADDEVACVDVGDEQTIVLGRWQRAAPSSYALDAPLAVAGEVRNFDFKTGAASSSETASTTDTTNYVDALTVSITLAAGTWTIYAVGGVELIHSASSTANYLVSINANDGTARLTPALSSTIYTLHVDNHELSGVTGGGAIDIKVKYKSSAAGTTTADNPWLFAAAKRTA